jgi:hypothetical protein
MATATSPAQVQCTVHPAACPDPQQWPQLPVLHGYSVQYTQLHAQTHSNGHSHQTCTGTVNSKSCHAYQAHNIGIEYSIPCSVLRPSHQRPTLPVPHRYNISFKKDDHTFQIIFVGTYHVSSLCGSDSELPFRDWDLLGDVALHATATLRKI